MEASRAPIGTRPPRSPRRLRADTALVASYLRRLRSVPRTPAAVRAAGAPTPPPAETDAMPKLL